MKFECQTAELLSIISTAARFAEKRANLPVLGSVLLSADGNRLTARATNLECGIEITIPAKIQSEGVVAVPASVFAGFLGNARGNIVTAATSGELFKVQTLSTSASIKTIQHDDFPILPRVSAEKSFTVKGSDLAHSIRAVAYCASLSAVKPELQSIMFFGDAGKFFAVATDSFRLAEKSIPLRAGGSVPQMLVPVKNTIELMRIMEALNGDVEIYYNDNQLSLQIDGIYYTSRLLDGTFPNYKQIIPKSFSTEALVLRDDLGGALKSLSVFSDKFAQVTLSIDPSKKTISLSSRNPDVGEQVSTLKTTASGDPATMSFNIRYLSDSLQPVAGESIRLFSNGPGKPMLVKDSSDDSFLYIAMPMNR